ncbi:potassium channel family protein [Mesobacillus zeae]|uniref:Two pore domain potassium channel family protein n=1 Tax=Mesobacillus zeae TaxID=1917180 RepID=A0A398B6C8_9BACI|nr:potassium channel family protein [Mesobacillus zeae]RID84368.1 two pore domain potassium channel family protein [Mesobacillus zeae]
MLSYLLISVIILCIIMSLRTLFIPNRIKGKKISFENFVVLTCIYATVMIGFGLIYFLIEERGVTLLLEGPQVKSVTALSKLATSLYFSAVTLFSVGYGDIAPVGIGRLIAVVEALIGYTIPAAFVARTVIDREG